jgi:uronate dehydrogenase
MTVRKTVLVTGAAGALATRLRARLRDSYALRLTDLRQPQDLAAEETFIAADLSHLDEVETAARGVDAIVHLGGASVERAWDEIVSCNIVGSYNLFEAARRQGVQRVVFASSNQVLGFHRRTRRLGADAPLRPSSRYGVSKMVGEGLGSLYADKHGLRVLCIRIGRCCEKPEDERRLSLWLHPDDLAQLVRIGIEHPDLHFDVVHGLSNNARAWVDNQRAFALGYRPAHDAEAHAAAALSGSAARDAVADLFMGGRLCALEFSGDLERAGR